MGRYLLPYLMKEPIHSWRTKLSVGKSKTTDHSKQKWDFKQRTINATEKEALNKPMIKENECNPPKPDKATMTVDGVEIPMYPVK